MSARCLSFVFWGCLLAVAVQGRTDSTGTARDGFFIVENGPAPSAAATLRPARAVADTVTCTLSAYLPQTESDPVQVELVCNASPDGGTPELTIAGERPEKMSERSTLTLRNGRESHEYAFRYKFFPSRSGMFVCRAVHLTFGGVVYDGRLEFRAEAASAVRSSDAVRPQPSHPMPSRGGFIAMGLACIGAGWLFFWIRFRREGKEDFAGFVLHRGRLPLTTDWAMTHYGFPATLLAAAAWLAALALWRLHTQETTATLQPLLWWVLLPLAAGLALWRQQTRRLFFRELRTPLDKKAVIEALAGAGERYGWSPDHAGDDCIVLHTNPSMPSLTRGEQIFVVFDQGRLWINSVNDLNKRSALFSFGRNRCNIRRVEEAIRAGERAKKHENDRG